MNRPLPSVVAPLTLAAVAGLGLSRAMAHGPLAAGIAGGVIAGLVAGLVLAWPVRSDDPVRLAMLRLLKVVVSAIVVLAGLAVVAADVGAIGRVGTAVITFLSIDLPAAGLSDLAVVPYVVVVPAATIATWAGRRGRTLVSIAAPSSALVVAALFAAPVGVPWWVPALFALAVGVLLVLVSREQYTDMEPLVGTSTAIRRQLPWWRPAVTGVLAVAIGLVALGIPLPGAFDVRQFIEPDVMLVEDENPLATAARLLRDPPPAAEGVDVSVDVAGESPGRLRLAVLDDYEPEGWRQRAEFTVTGEVVTPSIFDEVDSTQPSTVTVAQGPASTGLRATPTAGSPVGVVDPDGVRFSSSAGLFVATDAAASVRYQSLPRAEAAPPGAASAPVGVPAELYRCPDSPIVDDIAGVLAQGTTEPLERLNRIEAWLKLTKIYDPEAPGGQTIRSVERFLSQDFARGNLEVLVTSYAVLARCADVPVRVVVGYPAPAADGRREYTAADVAAWVETPIAGAGWVPLDPIPTPEEQQRQAELASQPPPAPGPPTEPRPEPTIVEPTAVDTGPSALQIALIALAALALVAGACWLWADGLRRRTLLRRRRLADPAAAVRFAWRSVVEALLDGGITLGPHLTASETARATTGRVHPAVTRLMSELAGLVDRARFDAPSTTDEHAGLAWALAGAALERQPMTWRRRLAPLLHPRRALRRLRATRGMPRRRETWSAELPASALVTAPQDIVDIPGYEVQARIGSGSTSVVYRGRDPSSGRPVAIKVFSIDVGGRSFDHQRFAWEARVAELVSGLPNLPEVFSSGMTEGGQPYLVTKVYERGTLHRRVQRGGPLSPGEVASAGRQLAMALETLHQHSILHGDVKPENVFVDDDGSMVLGDLGSAWLRADGGPAAMMTPPYAAPEVWLGHAPTVASDIYSLGLTLMFAASGRAPMAGSPPREDEIVEAFGSDIALALLEIDARRRPRTALAAAHRLGLDVDEHARRGPPVLALPTPTFTR